MGNHRGESVKDESLRLIAINIFRTYCVTDNVPIPLNALFWLNFAMTLNSRYYYYCTFQLQGMRVEVSMKDNIASLE